MSGMIHLMAKHRWRIIAWVFLAAFLASLGVVAWAGSEMASPARRPLMDYHREFLSAPAEHGMKIDRFTAGDGTPCVVCSPAGKTGQRGTTLRAQLSGRGIALPPPGQIVGNLVLLHGRNGRKEDYLPIAERLCAVGFRCIIPDLPAHGDHPLDIATYGSREAGLPLRVLDEAAIRFSFPSRPAGLLGISMGGSVAVHSAALADAPWKGLVVVASFDSLPSVMRWQSSHRVGTTAGPWFARSAARVYQWKTDIAPASIQPAVLAAKIAIPTLVAHGSADLVIPQFSGRRLFDAFPNTTANKWLEIPNAGHDNVLVTDFPIYAEIAGWMIRHVR